MTYKKLTILFLILISVFVLGFKKLPADDKCKYNQRAIGFESYFYAFFGSNIPETEVEIVDDCSYEFYQGAYTAFKVSGYRYDKINDFCNQVNAKSVPRAWNQCYFNLGSSISYINTDTIKDAKGLSAMITDKIGFCSKSYEGTKLSCIAGVYNGVNLIFQKKNLVSDRLLNDVLVINNPFWVCNGEQEDVYQTQCFRNIVSFVYDFTNGDIYKAINLIEQYTEVGNQRYETKVTFFSNLAFRSNFNQNAVINLCIQLVGENRRACINGYANGITETTSNGEETDSVINYCINPKYKFSESGECLRYGLSTLPVVDLKYNCLSKVPEVYKVFCEGVDK